MTTIKKHLELEQSKEKPNQFRIEYLNKILTRGTLTFNEWSSLGKFLEVEQSDRKVLKSCRQVIEYVGDTYIQVLTDGEFYYNSNSRGKNLDDVEKIVWKDIAEKLWCETC
jgi:hypothetical protein